MANKTVEIEAHLGQGWAIHADIRDHKVVIDQPLASGGTNEGPSPLEFFLFSLAGCVGTIGRIIAKQDKIVLRSMDVKVEADLDPSGLMGKEGAEHVGFQQVRIFAEIDADLSDAEKALFLDRVCERCPLHENIKLATHIVHQLSE